MMALILHSYYRVTIEVVDELDGQVRSNLPPCLCPNYPHLNLHLVPQQPCLLCQSSQSWQTERRFIVLYTYYISRHLLSIICIQAPGH